MKNIQEEVRKLHFQLKQKDTIIHQLKQHIEKKRDDDGLGPGGMGASKAEEAELDQILKAPADAD